MRVTSHALRVVSFVLAVHFAPAVALVANAGNTLTSTINGTNPVYPGAIDCDPEGASAINNAFLAVSQALVMAMTKIETNDNYPPFCAMFRIASNKRDVLEFFQRVNDLGPNPSMTVQTRPHLACAGLFTPLYYQCLRLPNREDLLVNLTSNTVVFCPQWFTRLPDPTPMRCPAIAENQFSRNAQGEVFGASRSTRMMEGLVGLYLGLDKHLRMYPPLGALFVLQEAMRISVFRMPSGWGNLVGFMSLEMNRCTDVPDISRPPWNNPRPLNTTGVDVA